MTLDPFLAASPYLQVHIVTAILGLILGPVVLYRSRRDALHKVLGYVWVTAMAALALSSFWIEAFWSPFYFGPLHGFAVVTLWSLWAGVRAAVRRDIERHQVILRSLYANGLILAGAFTFLPGRTVNGIVFGEAPQLGWLVIAVVLVVAFPRLLRPMFGAGHRA